MRRLDRNPRVRSLAALIATLGVYACTDGTGPGAEPVGSVDVSGTQTELQAGGTLQLAARVLSQSGVQLSDRQVTWSSSNQNVASVSAGGLVTAIASGTSMITASSGGHSGSVTIRVLPAQCSTGTSGSSITPGQMRTGALSESDCLFLHGAYADGWQLDLSTGTTLQIDLRSSAFDALVVVTDRQMNVIAWDDDGGEGLNSRLVHSFAAGNYIVWATSYGLNGTGAYEIAVQTSQTGSCTTPVGTVAVGQTVSGTLAATDCRLEDGSFADPWEFTLTAQTRVRIDLTSNAFDTFLIVTDRQMNVIAWDDDGGEGFNSRLVHTFTAGQYLVWANSYSPGVTGPYQLSIQAVASGSAQPGGVPLESLLLREKADSGEHTSLGEQTLAKPAKQ